MSEEWVYVKVRLRRSDYEALKARARALGFQSVADYIAETALRSLAVESAQPQAVLDSKRVSDEISRRLERIVVDLINPFTAKIDEMNRRLAEVIEMIEALRAPEAEERVERVERVERGERRPQARFQPRQEARERGGFDALSRLKEEGVLFGEEATWIKNPDRFFAYLEKKGAVVIDLAGEKVAVDPEFWDRFSELVESLEISDAEEASEVVAEKLGQRAAKLFKKMVASGVLTYDEDRRTWTILLPP